MSTTCSLVMSIDESFTVETCASFLRDDDDDDDSEKNDSSQSSSMVWTMRLDPRLITMSSFLSEQDKKRKEATLHLMDKGTKIGNSY